MERRKSQETKKMFIKKKQQPNSYCKKEKAYNNMFFRDRLCCCWHVYSQGFSIIISMWCILIAHSFVGFYPSLNNKCLISGTPFLFSRLPNSIELQYELNKILFAW